MLGEVGKSLLDRLASGLSDRGHDHAVAGIPSTQRSDQRHGGGHFPQRRGVDPEEVMDPRMLRSLPKGDIMGQESQALEQPPATPLFGQQDRDNDRSGHNKPDVVEHIPHCRYECCPIRDPQRVTGLQD